MPGHCSELWAVAQDPELWTWTLVHPRSQEDLAAYIADALDQEREGKALPFVVVHHPSGRPAGSTRYGALEPRHGRLEIGWTWLGREWQGTGLNAECKFLLLRHAFEVIGCSRVEFKTDALNVRSRRALLGIGAREEGTLRRHLRRWDGRLRDTVYFSILAEEWADVKLLLERRLEEGEQGRWRRED
jgi:RimJ/RimL family protein N-acetyltransferase